MSLYHLAWWHSIFFVVINQLATFHKNWLLPPSKCLRLSCVHIWHDYTGRSLRKGGENGQFWPQGPGTFDQAHISVLDKMFSKPVMFMCSGSPWCDVYFSTLKCESQSSVAFQRAAQPKPISIVVEPRLGMMPFRMQVTKCPTETSICQWASD